MKITHLVLPLALLLTTAAIAQETTSGADEAQPDGSGMMYGTEWPEAVGSTFMSKDGDKMTMRTKEEISASWMALSQADRDAVTQDCATFEAEAGGGSGSQGDGSAPAGADATGAAGELAANAGISGAAMAEVCAAVETL